MQINKFIKKILAKDTTDLPLIEYADLLLYLKQINSNITDISYFTWYTKSLKTLVKGNTDWVDKKIKISQQKDDNLKIANTSSELPIIAIKSSEYQNNSNDNNNALLSIRLEILITTDLSTDDSGLAYQIARRIRRVLNNNPINQFGITDKYNLNFRNDNELINYGYSLYKLDFNSQDKNFNDQVSLIYNMRVCEI